MSAREAVARALFSHLRPGGRWEDVPLDRLEAWGVTADAAMAAMVPHLELEAGRSVEAYDAEEHMPWWYTEFGVLCACGDPMDGDERCALMRAYDAGFEAGCDALQDQA